MSFSLIVIVSLSVSHYTIIQQMRISSSTQDMYDYSAMLLNKQYSILYAVQDMKVLSNRLLTEKEVDKIYSIQEQFKQKEYYIDSLILEIKYEKQEYFDNILEYSKALYRWTEISDKILKLREEENDSLAIHLSETEGLEARTKFETLLKNWIEHSNEKVKIHYAEVKKVSENTFRLTAIFMMVIFIFGVITTIMAVRSILLPLKNITKSLKVITNKNINTKLDIYRKDEMGELANSVRSLQETLSNKAKEEKIQNEQENWLKTGQTGLFEKMSGDLSVNKLGENVITFICKYIDAQAGTIFMYFERTKHLIMIGAYGVVPEQRNEYFKLGKGLVGQAAIDKKMLECPDVEKTYFRLKSAVAELLPGNIYVVPCIHENRVSAVFEIASNKKLSPLELKFLNLITENIAIFLNTTVLRERHLKMKRNRVS